MTPGAQLAQICRMEHNWVSSTVVPVQRCWVPSTTSTASQSMFRVNTPALALCLCGDGPSQSSAPGLVSSSSLWASVGSSAFRGKSQHSGEPFVGDEPRVRLWCRRRWSRPVAVVRTNMKQLYNVSHGETQYELYLRRVRSEAAESCRSDPIRCAMCLVL